MNTVYNGTDKVPNPGAKEEFWTTELTGFYGITENFTMLATIPFRNTSLDGHIHVHEDGEVEAHGDRGEQSGVGDVSILGRYTFFGDHTLDSTTAFAVLFGIKLPAGNTDGKTKDGEGFLDAHVQLGTGSADFLLGMSAVRSLERFAISANLLGAITGEGKAGDVKHRFGNSLNYDITGKYRIYPGASLSSKNQFFLALGLNGELRQKEKEDGLEVSNSGGHTVYLSPGIQFVLTPDWVFDVSYQRAIYHTLNGTQLG